MRYAVASLMLLALTISGCRQERSATVVARVGDAELTLEEARLHIDTTRGGMLRQLQEYASYWVNTELVYQEAKRRGIDNSKNVQDQLEDVKRQLVNQAYLNEQVIPDTGMMKDQSLREYFTAHASEFLVSEDMMRLNVVVFNDRVPASSFAGSVTRGEEWNIALQRILHDSTVGGSVVSYTTNQYYSQHTLYPPELWKVALGLSSGEVTFPVKTAAGYYVLQLLSRLAKGAPAEFEQVKDEARQRIALERQRARYTELLGTLRKRYNVEIILGTDAHQDTTLIQHNE